ncbi:MAG: FAD-dependent oxidoreductase [Gemmatimonadota bacterium]
MPEREYDIVAVGGGTAGLVTAAGAAYLGARPALVEAGRLGGDCLWTGCVPSKALLAAAHRAEALRHASPLGLPDTPLDPDGSRVLERVREARAQVARHDDPDRFRALGVDVHTGEARFVAPGLLEVEGVGRIRSRRFVIATGAEATLPPIPGLAEADPLTHADVFDRPHLPARLIVLGGGPVGVELAQAHRRLGVGVTLLERLDRILPAEDPDVAALVQARLERDGIAVRTGIDVERVERAGPVTTLLARGGDRVEADAVLVATGRRPRTEALALERAGVERDGHAVRVDARARTSARGVWAAGDVTGGPQFTHVAEHMAKVALQNALTPLPARTALHQVPRVTYTHPEVAHVGLSQTEAAAAGGRSHTYAFADLDRSIAEADGDGFVRISADRRGRILGATVVGTAAGELLLPLVLARMQGLPLSRLSATIFPYPTRMEAIKRAADAHRRAQLDSWKGALLRRVIRWLA